MATQEIYSFVQKFQQLRSFGYSAHLDIDTHAGNAWVGLCLKLDHVPHTSHQHAYHQKTFSASRIRRRERRAAAHAVNKHAEEASETTNDVEVNTSEKFIIENAESEDEASENTEYDTPVQESEVNTTEKIIIENVENKNEVSKNKEGEAVEAEVPVQENEIDPSIDEGNDNEFATQESSKEVDVMEEKSDNEEIRTVATPAATLAAPIPDEITVYGTATLDNCPDAEVNSDYGESIRRFLYSEPHLVQNISSVHLQHLSSRAFRNNTHTHTVSVTMRVRTSRLWETPASYVRKHLGSGNIWERSNGTIVRLSRIHQK